MSEELQVFEDPNTPAPTFREEGSDPKFAYFEFEHSFVEKELLDPSNPEDAEDIQAIRDARGGETVPLRQALKELGLEE